MLCRNLLAFLQGCTQINCCFQNNSKGGVE
ncbi:hypothetical protein FZC78_13275 [Rossellomorea vietnamensis]|uniref:Uncharacterized protein n=1 Tax=Rossellomorea vietnamensis TaxID=218284 RepID=A0A5D4NRT0_9BACI|nr:hypothetical protein FZC78_13275 [Rossellomorea vietnamensis]